MFLTNLCRCIIISPLHKERPPTKVVSGCRQKGFGMCSFRNPFVIFIEFEAIIEESRPLRGLFMPFSELAMSSWRVFLNSWQRK
ncbi:hypothetical protein C8K15_1771 [Paenisporosarcina sp. OV554]|nr:hypothetical protein C8K15_1771 [Paenisporosarcina sp. OV554]